MTPRIATPRFAMEANTLANSGVRSFSDPSHRADGLAHCHGARESSRSTTTNGSLSSSDAISLLEASGSSLPLIKAASTIKGTCDHGSWRTSPSSSRCESFPSEEEESVSIEKRSPIHGISRPEAMGAFVEGNESGTQMLKSAADVDDEFLAIFTCVETSGNRLDAILDVANDQNGIGGHRSHKMRRRRVTRSKKDMQEEADQEITQILAQNYAVRQFLTENKKALAQTTHLNITMDRVRCKLTALQASIADMTLSRNDLEFS